MPCSAAKGLECVPFDSHSAAVSDLHLPCHAQAMIRPCRSSLGHGTARPSRDCLWATCGRSVSSGYHSKFHEVCYQKHTSLRCRWPVWNQTTFVMDKENSGSSTLQKKNLLNCWTSNSATTRNFMKDTALSKNDRGAAWHGMARERHGICMGVAWARHAMCESALSVSYN